MPLAMATVPVMTRDWEGLNLPVYPTTLFTVTGREREGGGEGGYE